MTSVDPRYVQLQREIGWYTSAVFSLGLLVGSFILLTPRRWYWCLLLWIVGSIAAVWWLQRWPAVEYRHLAYRVDDEGLEIHRGVVWRQVANVPRSRVQHIDVAQGPLDRKHGLGRLIVFTAGTAHSRVELPGLPYDLALDLRTQLLPQQATNVV